MYIQFSPWSAPAPSSPTIVMTTPQSTSIMFTWTQPDGNVVISYEIAYSYHGSCTGLPVAQNFIVNGGTREYTVLGLQEFSEYTITLTAVNRAGSNLDSRTLTTLPSGI